MIVCANISTFPEPVVCLELMCDKKQNAQVGTTFSYFCLHRFFRTGDSFLLMVCSQIQEMASYTFFLFYQHAPFLAEAERAWPNLTDCSDFFDRASRDRSPHFARARQENHEPDINCYAKFSNNIGLYIDNNSY